MEWLPLASELVTNEACPVPSSDAEPSVAAPSLNVTVPVGVPPAPVTAPVKVTGAPHAAGVAVPGNAVVLPAWFTI